MKRLIVTACVAVAALATGAAAAKSPTPAHARAYKKAYHEVSHRFGRRVPGRNILENGIRAQRSVTDAQTVASLQVLERILAPAAPAPLGAKAAPSTVTGSTAGASGVPACASESGTNYSTGAANTNGSSGATGRYQILPSTAAAYGCSLATPAGQDACAQTIYEHQGAGAWVGCGG